MPENILVDTKIMFLSRLDDKLWQKTGKMIIFGVFFEIFFLFWQNFQKLKKTFLIDLEWSTLAKGKVAISKTVATAASRYTQTNKQTNIIIIPTEYKNHHEICESVGGR